MDGSLACYEELGVWCNFNIPWFDSSPRPRVRGDGEIAPNIAKKNIWQSLIRQLAVTKRLDVWKLKTTLSKGDNRPIFWWKHTSLPLPIFEEAWRTRFISFVSEHHSFYYRLPDGTATELTQRCYGEWCNSSPLVFILYFSLIVRHYMLYTVEWKVARTRLPSVGFRSWS